MPKKGRDTLSLKNWRPITLLNQDYKLYAKALATRLKTTLPDIIHSDQTGFVHNRYIGENIVKLVDIIKHCDDENIPAVIMSIDCVVNNGWITECFKPSRC